MNRRLKWNIVQYGDDPTEYLEPVNAAGHEDIIGFTGPILQNQVAGGVGRCWGIRNIKGKLCDVHAFDDFDAANSSYTDLGNGKTPSGF